MKKEILNKIKSAQNVFVYNQFLESYFKTTKAELAGMLKQHILLIKQNGNNLESFLNDFNNRLAFDKGQNIYFD